MKVFLVAEGKPVKCGGCNWPVYHLFALANSQDEANALFESGEAGLCGDCLTELLFDGRYEILRGGRETMIVKCPACRGEFIPRRSIIEFDREEFHYVFCSNCNLRYEIHLSEFPDELVISLRHLSESEWEEVLSATA